MIDRLWNANLGLRIPTEYSIPGNHSPVCQLFALLVAFVVFFEFLGECIDHNAAMKDKRLTKKIRLPISNRLCLTRLEAHITLSS